MDSSFSGPNNQNDDVFFDALPHCPFDHCSGIADSSPESSIISDPHPPSPTNTIRRRPNRHRSPVREPSNTVSDDPSTAGAGTRLRSNRNLENSNKNENFPEKCDSNQEKLRPSASRSVTTEEGSEESTVTTAEDDGDGAYSADSVEELVNSPFNWLDYVTGLVIRAIVFQINVFVFIMKCPMLFMLHAGMFFVDPFGSIRKGKSFFVEILGRVWCCVCGCLGHSAQGWFKEHKSLWNAAFSCGWGLLWPIYVCFILCGLLVSSIVVSGILVNGLVEKPFEMRQVLNFDYTKQSPVAFVPVMSCDGILGEQDTEKEIAVREWMGRRVIPANQKVQVSVSLVVPESEYNTNLGVFQIRVDFLSSDGKTIWSARQPCMLKFISEPVRLSITFLKLVPLLTGYVSETQTLNVNMRGFVEGNVPTSCLKISLEQRAEYSPGAGIPQMYDSLVVIESELPLFKRIIWHWKMIIFVWITITVFMMELLFVLLCCLPVIIPRIRQRSASATQESSSD